MQILGLSQTPSFDTVHVRIKAQLRDNDAPHTVTDEQARQLARAKPLEPFTEVWSFVRRPGAQSKTDAAQGNCPNCGAPFAGGASNQCEFCKAIVNSGNYDWVLAEMTQGSEFSAESAETLPGWQEARRRDTDLATEALEDRASLCFWKWVDAQVMGDASRLSKVAEPSFVERLRADLSALASQGRRKVFLECAVGSVDTRAITEHGAEELAHFEIRWSARAGIGPVGQKPPNVPSVPNRWVLTLQRSANATTASSNGLSTSRCPNCSAPLSDNGTVSCEYCGTMLATGERDWVIRQFSTWESWVASSHAPRTPSGQAVHAVAPRVADQEERQRLLYVMAAMAAADGVVDERERKLLKMCSDRWGVPYANVELALSAGPGLFERLLLKGSVEAERFLAELVQMALVDGRIDRKERQMLEAAAAHLGVPDKLPALLQSQSGAAG